MCEKVLSWHRLDIESRRGFEGKKYTGTNSLFTFILGILLSLLFYGVLYCFFISGRFQMVNMFFHGGPENRSIVPYFIVFLSWWSLAILFVKSRKLALKKRALELSFVSESDDFQLTPLTAAQLLEKIDKTVDEASKFMLLNRIVRAISNLRNIGGVSGLAADLGAQAENDEVYLESTYTVVKGFIWAIPVLGFIGTVLGLSKAIGGFGKVVAGGADLEKLKDSLSGVTAGLSIAFETTLIALVAALIIQLILTMLKNKEEDFLDECSDYCHKHLISKLRIVLLRDEFKHENE